MPDEAGQSDMAARCLQAALPISTDGFAASTVSCTGASNGGACDNDSADHCSGTANTCVDAYQSASFTCRPAAAGGRAEERRGGEASSACWAAGFAASTVSCTGASNGGACDNDSADHCSGTGNDVV